MPTRTPDNGDTVTSNVEPQSVEIASSGYATKGIFIILAIYALFLGRDFFMPVILAFLFALTLTPMVRFATKRGIPAPLSATALVLGSAGLIGFGGYLLSGPVTALIQDAPQIGYTLTERVQRLRGPYDMLMEFSGQIDDVTDSVSDAGVVKVAVQQPGILSQAAGNMLSIATNAAIVVVLSMFLLASGTMFYEKIIQSFTLMSDKKRALRIVYDVEREVSRYLLTVAIINSALGLVIGLGLWVLGMPTPLLWGVMAAMLNFLPYIGAFATIMIVAVISIISFDSLSYAMLAPAFVVFCNFVEGQIVTPLVVGRRLELNAVAIFIAVAFWSWLWGFIGALIAVPLLVIIKVFCDHFDGWQSFGNFLAAQQTIDTHDSDPEKPAS